MLLSTDWRYVLNFNNHNFQHFVSSSFYVSSSTNPKQWHSSGLYRKTTEYYNTVCLFSCNAGFNAVGSLSRKCLENGIWSGQDFLCQGEMNRQGYFAELGMHCLLVVSFFFLERAEYNANLSS